MFQNKWDLFVYFIVFIKFIFISSAITHLSIKFFALELEAVDSIAEHWKEKSEFIFKICMAILLMASFHPLRVSQALSKETRILIYLFGVIILLTSDWKKFLSSFPLPEAFGEYFD